MRRREEGKKESEVDLLKLRRGTHEPSMRRQLRPVMATPEGSPTRKNMRLVAAWPEARGGEEEASEVEQGEKVSRSSTRSSTSENVTHRCRP